MLYYHNLKYGDLQGQASDKITP